MKGLCPLMCGKAVPFRPIAPLFEAAPPNQAETEAEPQRLEENFTESQRLSAHQAAEPRLLNLIFKHNKARLETLENVFGTASGNFSPSI